ncbi:MAG TPA: acyltransferase [Gemmatimonadaceae bacterium]|nr:acyltransferase [Gemmatimonadaceae bacterium]
MNPFAHIRAALSDLRQRSITWLLGQRLRARHPTLIAHPTVAWDYGFGDIDAIEIGKGVTVGAFAEIVVYKRSPRSTVAGRLILEDGAIVTAGVNIRAAGGTVRIGANTGVGQHTTIVASNHTAKRDGIHLRTDWDTARTGVDIGANVWIGASCVILPGTTIGPHAVIAAGSVVRGEIPANEVWGGVPARKIRDL